MFTPTPLSQNQTQSQQNQSSYAKVAEKSSFPTKEQAIIIDSIENVQLKDYVYALGKVINPKDIKFVSRISKNRICMYLSDKSQVDKLTESKTTITINNSDLEIRPLLTKFKRIILSNVCPIIPHSVLMDQLKNLNIRLGSQMTFLRAGVPDPEFSHILSFRRQVYIHPDDVDKIPNSIQITYDETKYWIYLSDDDVTCFLCKQTGHLAKNCQINDQQEPQDNPNIQKTDETSKTTQEKPFSSPPKRALSETTDNSNPLQDLSTNQTTPDIPNPPTLKKKVKKSKTNDASQSGDEEVPNTAASQLSAIEKEMSPNHSYPLSATQLLSVLERSRGNKEIDDIILDYTKNPKEVLSQIDEWYSLLSDPNTKRSFTSLKKKLKIMMSKPPFIPQDGMSEDDESEENL